MDSKRKNEIREITKRVTKKSERFQLIHATYAIQTMIKGMVIDSYVKECNDLRERIQNKMAANLNFDQELKEKEILDYAIKQKNFRIDVEYIDSFTEDMSRIIRIDNAFVINLPKSLAENIFDDNDNYNYEVIQKIRHLMAHELGHLMLHTKELLQIHGTQGSVELSDDEKEVEANFFANELIEQRKKRNEIVYKDGGAHNRF